MADLISLYRIYDRHDKLLYVGISKNFIARLNQHEGDKEWSQEITKVLVEYYVGRTAARNAETKAIKEENPAHNIMRPEPGRKVQLNLSIDIETAKQVEEMRKRGINPCKLFSMAMREFAKNDFELPIIITE